jgi:hypothetical protein
MSNNHVILDPIFNDTIVLDITGLLDGPIDNDLLLAEVKAAEKVHSFARRTPVWLGIPLRSANGTLGEDGLGSTGVANSPDENIYQDTPAMQPYIKSLIDQIGAPIYKVRILKLISQKSIPEHADNFQAPDIIRFHIPIVTHPLVEFWLDGNQYYIPPKRLSYLNVRKRHKVINRSHIDRIHIVFDVKQTPELIERVIKCAKPRDPLL